MNHCLFLVFVATTGAGGDGSKKTIQLEVYNQPSVQDEVPGFVKLTEGATLNLTCRVNGQESDVKSGDVSLSWYLPNNLPQTRYDQKEFDGNSLLVIPHVLEADTGDYECWAKDKSSTSEGVKKILKVFIEPRRGNCQHGQYQCEGPDKQYCIATRYRCDSHSDCPSGDDESPTFCGSDPCKGKIVCPELDFRCIDPTVYCCDPHVSPDCKFMYPCCESVIEFSIRSRYYQTGVVSSHSSGDEGRGKDMAYLHSTVYTIIGCSIAFLLIVLGLVAAICRLHLLRKSQRGGRGTGGGRPHPPITLHDLDIYFSERNQVGEDERDYQRIGITYNINHGVQIMGGANHRGAGQPPPYTTNPRRGGRGPRTRGPPPPYMSHENIAEPLIEDDNNNGDINGNSDMVNHNVRQAAPEAGPLVAPVPVVPVVHEHEQVQAVVAGPQQGVARGSSPPPRYPGLDSSSDTDTD